MRVFGVLLTTCLLASSASAQGSRSGRSGSRERAPAPVVDANPYATTDEDNPYGGEGEPATPTDAASPAPVEPTPVVTPPPPAAEPSPYAEAEPSPYATTEEPATNERIKFHALGLGWHATMFSTQVRDGYTLQGPELAYTYFVGRRWGFSMRSSLYFPTSGYMAGPDGEMRIKLRESYEQSRIGLDGIIGAGRRYELPHSLVVLVGMGLHAQSFRLNGAQYYPVEGITGGIGAYGRIDWRINRYLSIGADVMFAMDLVDFIGHANRIFYLSPAAGALTVGVSY